MSNVREAVLEAVRTGDIPAVLDLVSGAPRMPEDDRLELLQDLDAYRQELICAMGLGPWNPAEEQALLEVGPWASWDDPVHRMRYGASLLAAVACQVDPAHAVKWHAPYQYQSVGYEEVTPSLIRLLRSWPPQEQQAFAQQLAAKAYYETDYELALELIREMAVQPMGTDRLALVCLGHYERLGRESGLDTPQFLSRLRSDPFLEHLAPRLVSLMAAEDGHEGLAGRIAHDFSSEPGSPHEHTAANVLALLAREGFADRAALVRAAFARIEGTEDAARLAGYFHLLAELSPTDEEAAPHYDRLVQLVEAAPRAAETGVLTAVRERAMSGDMPDERIATWLRLLNAARDPKASRAQAALHVLVDAGRLDERQREQLEQVCLNPRYEVIASMPSCVRCRPAPAKPGSEDRPMRPVQAPELVQPNRPDLEAMDQKALWNLNAWDVATLLPDIPEVLSRCRMLATLSLCADDPRHNVETTGMEQVFHLDRGPCTTFSAFFTDAGALLVGWARDADMSYQDGDWHQYVTTIPEVFRKHFDDDFLMTCEDGPLATSILWREAGQDSWRTSPLLPDPEDLVDFAGRSFEHLVRPDPHVILDDLTYEVSHDSLTLEAVRQMVAYRPLTDDIVAGLHPSRALGDVASAIEAIGYPCSSAHRP
ncbi:hypothetical protein ACFZAV_42985 [Streptomyces sp. NPDC008343]|uniref:hypothetical protein n=1 Tax=Streptomyces sp. NPDC008343 TaxID=3364828 RepID=UPI0036EA623C